MTEGRSLSQTLDVLNSELLRLMEEEQLSKLERRAEEERNAREVVEEGRRQAEYLLRQREQRMYEEIITVHQKTAEIVLGNSLSFA